MRRFMPDRASAASVAAALCANWALAERAPIAAGVRNHPLVTAGTMQIFSAAFTM
jgi:hypothetical protein